jgi:hypothetical protein
MNCRELLGTIKLTTNSSTIGLHGENLAKQGLRNAGLSVRLTAYNARYLSDLYVNKKYRVEVKTAKENKRSGYYKICLNKHDKHGMTTLSHADFVLIQLISNAGLVHIFFIPASELVGKKSINLSLNEKSKYHKFLSSYRSIGKELQ